MYPKYRLADFLIRLFQSGQKDRLRRSILDPDFIVWQKGRCTGFFRRPRRSLSFIGDRSYRDGCDRLFVGLRPIACLPIFVVRREAHCRP